MTSLDHLRDFGFSHHHRSLIKSAINAATKGHNDTNHMYGDASYTIHLAHVVDVAYRFIHLVPLEARPYVIAACWLHDSIEDARMSFNDVRKATDVRVAEMVRAVTNYSRGRNRDERMPDFIYKEIAETDFARFVKLCDRIANIEYSGKMDMYEKEHDHFYKMLFHEKYLTMFLYMEYLFDVNKSSVIV
jgi:(p)ppGpp synthase/HD superfamily hydrolase